MDGNNTTAEYKNTLEVNNSIITEAEEWMHELEDRIMAITEAEKSKMNEKKLGQSQRPLRQCYSHQHLNYMGPRWRRGKERVWENSQEDCRQKLPLTWERK